MRVRVSGCRRIRGSTHGRLLYSSALPLCSCMHHICSPPWAKQPYNYIYSPSPTYRPFTLSMFHITHHDCLNILDSHLQQQLRSGGHLCSPPTPQHMRCHGITYHACRIHMEIHQPVVMLHTVLRRKRHQTQQCACLNECRVFVLISCGRKRAVTFVSRQLGVDQTHPV